MTAEFVLHPRSGTLHRVTQRSPQVDLGVEGVTGVRGACGNVSWEPTVFPRRLCEVCFPSPEEFVTGPLRGREPERLGEILPRVRDRIDAAIEQARRDKVLAVRPVEDDTGWEGSVQQQALRRPLEAEPWYRAWVAAGEPADRETFRAGWEAGIDAAQAALRFALNEPSPPLSDPQEP